MENINYHPIITTFIEEYNVTVLCNSSANKSEN
jgi:hypothetical protein